MERGAIIIAFVNFDSVVMLHLPGLLLELINNRLISVLITNSSFAHLRIFVYDKDCRKCHCV